MYFSAREIKILDILLHQNGIVTITEIATALNVSTRTIQRDIKIIEDTAMKFNLTLGKKAGTGLVLSGTPEDKERLISLIEWNSNKELSSQERQQRILSLLLSTQEPVKLISIANELNVAVGTVGNDLDEIEEVVKKFHIEIIRKRGYGVEIVGSEENRRKLMSFILLSHLEIYEFIEIFSEDTNGDYDAIVDSVNERLLGFVDKQRIVAIEKEIQEIRLENDILIADHAYIGLVVHLALAIERISQGAIIEFDEQILSEIRGTKEFNLAKGLASNLKRELKVEINEAEIGYITMQLIGSTNFRVNDDLLEEELVQVGYYVQELLDIIGRDLKYDLSGNSNLFKDLVTHLKPALFRIKRKMRVENPLLKQIKSDYENVFNIVRGAVEIVFSEYNVPDEEIGFIVTHIASAVLYGDKIQDHNVLVVCASGIGTSKMLVSKLTQAMPGLNTKFISMFELSKVDTKSYSTIISTIKLKDFTEKYHLVSPLISDAEIQSIRKAIISDKHFKLKKLPSTKEKEISGDLFISNVKRQNAHFKAILDIMCDFRIFELSENIGVEGALLKFCAEVDAVEDVRFVVNELLERERLSGISIPGTELALFHTRCENVNKPHFSIIRLNTSVERSSMDGSTQRVKSLLVVLCPNEATSEDLEVLSEISAIIIQSKATSTTFEVGNKEDILSLLANEFKKNIIIKNKLKE